MKHFFFSLQTPEALQKPWMRLQTACLIIRFVFSLLALLCLLFWIYYAQMKISPSASFLKK